MKNQNIILGGVLIAIGVGAYLFLKKNKIMDTITGTDKDNSTQESEQKPETQTKDSTVGKSNVIDVPVNTPILSAEAIKKQAEELAKQKADALELLKSAENKEFEFKNIFSGKTETQILAEAKSISAKIADNDAKIRKYKKKSSKEAVRKDNENKTAELLAMGFLALPNGEVQKI